ncbi:MAG: FAD:protein FMN transferase, partial [Planctomycetales bacterium]|nr:FAD:protein FMN transferase [Planctomycetales bacterium]
MPDRFNSPIQLGLTCALLCLLNMIGPVPTVYTAEPIGHDRMSQRFEQSQRHMGTQFNITLYAGDAETAERAFKLAFARIAELDAALSNYQSESELNRLCRSAPHATPVSASDDLWRVLQRSQEISRQTQGAFDVSIGPLTKLWRQSRRQQQWPTEERWNAAASKVDFRAIKLTDETHGVQLMREQMQLDLGGIAKGDALDEALRAIEACDIHRVLIDGGGDVLAADPPPNAAGWRIAVAGLERDGNAAEWLTLTRQAAATSGDLWQYVEFDGRRYSHLIDARSGRPIEGQRSVTVLASTGWEADAWASVISIVGAPAGLAQLERQPDC